MQIDWPGTLKESRHNKDIFPVDIIALQFALKSSMNVGQYFGCVRITSNVAHTEVSKDNTGPFTML